ncbi:phosphodiesterase [Arenibaculum pallidiluteum]|uniref:phosphodiesterase n=1 Tax=Arenibaculum pallidiluteum TaxID=2812559 RepID=UPI001A96EDC5|nr:phosphodiesterase [Arenibaculum pallidiluteum]
MLIAQLTDLHVKPAGRLAYRRVDTALHLRAAVDALLRLDPQPDVVVITGDLVDAGLPEEYALLRELLKPLTLPLYVIPGNHDQRAPLAAAFADHDYLPRDGGFLHYAVENWPLRLIALDTVVPGQGGGMLCDERLRWLDARLSEAPGAPTAILMHHPPFRTGIAHMDRIGLGNAPAFDEVLRRHPHVERVLCGHIHRPIQARFGGTLASTAPSVAHQVALDLTQDGPSAFVMEPPGFQIHLWDAEAGIRSHTAVIGDFGGASPFFDPEGRLID